MNISTSIRERAERLATCVELDVEASLLPHSAVTLSDESVFQMLGEFAGLANDVGRVQAVLAGVAAQRSRREDGHSGLSAVQGHATPASLIQSITGGTRADETRQVRVGTSLLDGEVPATNGPAPVAPAKVLWHEPLRRALLEGRLTAEQQDAIRLGLGEPRVHGSDVLTDAVEEAWSLATEGLIGEAASMPTEELLKRARVIRDMLDPLGAEERYARRYDKREFSMWVDDEGQHRARVVFDDEMALWVRSVLDAALRPRRGGPRFVAEGERRSAEELTLDPRTNKQLEYDLMMDVLRAGSLAEAKDVFGARQPGVRMVVIKHQVGQRDAFGRLLALGHAEDGGDALPGSVIDRALCMTGSIDVSLDGNGNPLDLGRSSDCSRPGSASPSPRATVDAYGRDAPGTRHTARPTTATISLNTTGAPISTVAYCCASSTTCCCTTEAGGSHATAETPSCCIHPARARRSN